MISQIRKSIQKIFPTYSRKIYYYINIIKYRGNKYFCPICDRGYNVFLTGPDKLRINSKCPGCGSLERHRLLWLYLTNELEIKNRKMFILNIAPDYATQTALKKLKNITYTSIDLNSPLAIKKKDITNLDLDDNYFDAILCYHVLEHVENDNKALIEIFRVLKPDGWAIIQSPVETDREVTLEDTAITTRQERKRVFGQEDHVRIYGKDYTRKLENAGFDVTEDDFVNKFTQDEKAKYVLDSSEVIYFCSKKSLSRKGLKETKNKQSSPNLY